MSTPEKPDTTSHKSKSIGQYILGKTIGEGTFGKVKLGTHILTSEKVAVKILEKERIKDVADIERVAREIHILKLIRHPNIIQLYEIIETPKQLFLIMEYASGGELFDYIVEHTRVEEREACKFFQQIISGVEYIHKLGVVHRDLKPENLLLDENKNIKIVDFGLSNTYKPDELLKTACGSPCYAAPEMIQGKNYAGSRVDLWSCGVILYALLAGYLPFEDPDTGKLYKKILSCSYECPEWISEKGKDIISKILNTDPETRYTIQDIRNHPWYRLSQQSSSEGILVGYQSIPINLDILNKLEPFGFDLNYCQSCIEANKHNNLTTAYYLLLKKYQAPPQSPILDKPAIIHPHIMPFPPRFSLEMNAKPKHRKYKEKRIESTGGSSSKDKELIFMQTPFTGKLLGKTPRSARRSVRGSSHSPLKAKLTSERRYQSVGRKHSKEPRESREPREPSEPKPKSIRPARKANYSASRGNTPGRINSSDYSMKSLGNSIRQLHVDNSYIEHKRRKANVL
ncbi:unnamed protein product [Blepharisma stoltei]|uniref:Protein kinase domain-containing protein n=1 Tax=Blepharisma stoltei TaxID=1481888 RepID=A0AAU9K5Z6_9CILI|nr:unnamed protein product [Blepharisma stoltei]